MKRTLLMALCLIINGGFALYSGTFNNIFDFSVKDSFAKEDYISLNQVKESYPLVVVYLHDSKSFQSYLNEIKHAVKHHHFKPTQVVFVITNIGSQDLVKQKEANEVLGDFPLFITKEKAINFSSPTTVAYSANNSLIWSEEVYAGKLLIGKIKKHFKENKNRETVIDSALVGVKDSAYRNKSVYKHPFKILPDFEALKSANEVKVSEGSKVVIYTFLGCKPCLQLANQLKAECDKGKIAKNQIIFVNLIDKATPHTIQYIKKNYDGFAYYFFEQNAETFPYPTVTAYDSTGAIQWEKNGYSLGLKKVIQKHLKN